MPLPLPTYTATDYLWQFQRLLPRGRIWQRGWGTLQAAYLLTLMPTWARLHGRLNDLIGEIFPCSTGELLPEWEASLGLPDPCIGELPSVHLRQAAVCAKFIARGGQSIAYFERLAEALGYTVKIEQFLPFRASINSCGQPLLGEAWAFAWYVVAPPVTITYFRAGLSRAGEPLATWGNTLLECVIRQNAPAHTVVVFVYQGSLWDEDASAWDNEASLWDRIV